MEILLNKQGKMRPVLRWVGLPVLVALVGWQLGSNLVKHFLHGQPHPASDDDSFDREVCPEPCGKMHYRCRVCGKPTDCCVHERTCVRRK